MDDPEPNDIWPDPAETANFFDPPAGQSLLSAAQLTPRKDADTSHTGPPRFNVGLGADWQAIPGLGRSEDEPPPDEAEIDEAETDDMPDEADDLSWDTPLQAGELGEYD